METIVAASITAAASIIVAIVQAQSAARQAAMLRQQVDTKPEAEPSKPRHEPEQGTASQESFDKAPTRKPALSRPKTVRTTRGLRAWLWVTGILVAVAIFVPHILESISHINVALMPLATILLAIFCPIPWGWAAALVAVLHGFNYFGYYWRGGTFSDEDLHLSLMFYIGNAFVVAVVAFFRLRSARRNAI